MTSGDAMTRWRQWQGTPWGRLRYTRAEVNRSHHLPPPPAKVLDLGGGDGADAVRLARRGHRVTVVDPSAEMLAGAGRTFAEEGLPVELVRADLADHLPGGFDVVLLHNVIQYLDDPAAAVRRAVSRAAPGGLVLTARFFHLVARR